MEKLSSVESLVSFERLRSWVVDERWSSSRSGGTNGVL
jgi:hypothetical protein